MSTLTSYSSEWIILSRIMVLSWNRNIRVRIGVKTVRMGPKELLKPPSTAMMSKTVKKLMVKTR